MTKIQVERSALDRKGSSSLRYESSGRRQAKLQKCRESGNVTTLMLDACSSRKHGDNANLE